MKKFIGIVLSLLLLIGCLLASTDNRKEEEKQLQQIEDTLTYFTDNDFSRLYTTSDEVRNESDNIVEMTQSEAQLLLKVARQEGGSSIIGQCWVMRTIINRTLCEDKDFGSTIGEVLFKEGQFEVISNGSYANADVNVNSHLALALVESGWNETEGALFWESCRNSPSSWHKKNLTFIKEVEGNLFYK